MPAPSDPIGVSRSRAITLDPSGQINELDTWLGQAAKTRDTALQLMRSRMDRDLEAAQSLGVDSRTLSAEKKCADKLTAEYLFESEKLFELMRPAGARVASGHDARRRV